MQPGRLLLRLRLVRAAAAAALALALGVSPALAHGAIERSAPAAGATEKKPPKVVRVTLAEPPAQGSGLVVTDGCRRRVSGEVSIEGDVLAVAIGAGEPGRWRVAVRSISSVDAHLVKDSFGFEVTGKKDCSREPTDDESPDDVITDDTSSRPPIANPEADDSSFPVVAFALGTIAVVALAIALRRNSGKP